MKRSLLFILAGSALLGFSACSTSKTVRAGSETDDVYYSLRDAKAERKALAKAQEEEEQRLKDEAAAAELAEKQREARSKPGSNYYDEPFDYDDYYDYEYATRISRFSNPMPGYGYYDSYYTNAYFYSGNPYNFGTSIYNGYSFWGPQYQTYNYNPSAFWYWNSGWGWGTGMGYVSPVMMYPGNGFGYSPYYPMSCGWGGQWCGSSWGNSWNQPWGGSWYDPWNSWGYYNDPYGMGFQNGYWNGLQSGMANNNNNNYYNSFDSNSDYYGPRRTTNGTGGRGEAVQNGTLSERFTSEIAAENGVETMDRAQINDYLQTPAARPVQGISTPVVTTPAAPSATEGRTSTTTPTTTVPAPPTTTTDRGTTTPSRGTVPAPPTTTTDRATTVPAPPSVNTNSNTTAPPARPRTSDATPPAPNLNTTPRNSETPRSNPTPRVDNSSRSSSTSAPASSPSSTPRSSGSSTTTSRPR